MWVKVLMVERMGAYSWCMPDVGTVGDSRSFCTLDLLMSCSVLSYHTCPVAAEERLVLINALMQPSSESRYLTMDRATLTGVKGPIGEEGIEAVSYTHLTLPTIYSV